MSTVDGRASRWAVPALVAATAAWVPLAALAVVGVLPAGRRDTGSGLFDGPSWPFVAILFTIPFTTLLGLTGLVLAWAARSRRAGVVAGAALLVLVVAVAALDAFTDSMSI